jgi:hypothetical protein
MGVKEIPASRLYTCDVCGKESKHDKYWGTLKVLQAAYDFHGDAVADGTVTRLLCDECKPVVVDAINAAYAGLKAAPKGGP